MTHKRHLFLAFSALICVFLTGVVGYTITEQNHAPDKWSVFDSIFMTVITLTTVGYDDGKMSESGRVFTVFLLIGGFGVCAYSISSATAFIIEGQLHEIFRRRKMRNSIDRLSNHYIICGLGDTGVHSLDELLQMEVEFVGIEREDSRIAQLLETRDFLYVAGDATDDEVLHRAGVDRARGLISSLSRDQDNLFTVLSAKQLNPNLRVVSKAVEDNSPPKLLKAGAADVVLADQIGGVRLASRVMRPDVVDLLDIMIKHQEATRFTQSVIRKNSRLIGLTLDEANIQDRTGLVTVAIRNRNGRFEYNPPADWALEQGDAFIVIADNERLQKLHELTGDT
ncbi:MAG: potassium channel protein [Candidatus Poribacteria bacterium]|nr:potassium channel protein [Candidatus Poribacteria bacterium]MDE0505264.1 potassium channel protein [Candidatus Poribacteria bacterium]